MRIAWASIAAAAIAAALTVPAVYSALRAWEVLSAPAPAEVLGAWSPHIPLFRRAGVGLYVAGMVGPLAFVAARADLARTLRVLGRAVIVVALVCGVQGVLLP
jgi:hypothetical protein